jgi:hypothetical protein
MKYVLKYVCDDFCVLFSIVNKESLANKICIILNTDKSIMSELGIRYRNESRDDEDNEEFCYEAVEDEKIKDMDIISFDDEFICHHCYAIDQGIDEDEFIKTAAEWENMSVDEYKKYRNQLMPFHVIE